MCRPERVAHIAEALSPLPVDLGVENNRSPGVEIVQFGNDLLLSKPRGAPYKGVSRIGLPRKADDRDRWIRRSVGVLCKAIKDTSGRDPENLAILASWNKGVTMVSKALRGTKPEDEIHHQVHFDETEVFLASRVVAFCLEPKRPAQHTDDLATLLNLIAAVFKSRGLKNALRDASRLIDLAASVLAGTAGNRSPLSHAAGLLKRLETHRFLGDPGKDWLFVRGLFRSAATPILRTIASDVEYLMVFNRGRRISAGLRELWQDEGAYSRGRLVLDTALAEDQLLSGVTDLHGLNVMTIHKAKGKEFDGVVIIDDANVSPLAYSREQPPFPRARRLLRVGVTRARFHTLLLTDVIQPCPLLAGHNL